MIKINRKTLKKGEILIIQDNELRVNPIDIKTLEIIQDQKKKNKDKMSIKEETIKETFNGKVQIKEALDNGEVTWLPTKMKEEIKQFHKTIKDPI